MHNVSHVESSDSKLKQMEIRKSPPASTASTGTVSVIIPCYNEENFIGKVLENLSEQYELDNYEIVIIDGQSEDRTLEVIEAFRVSRPDVDVMVLENPGRAIPVSLNLGIAAAKGDIIARMDAHAVPSSRYIRRCVEALVEGISGAVGMPCIVNPGADTVVARAIAQAVSHPFGIGDAKYRLGRAGSMQESVDTVAFACFRKSLWSELGGYNESLLTNEDYDFNYRVRKSGREVILDRGAHCDYFARATIKTLATQYWRYGSWKAQMVRLQPKSIKVRHLVAPVFVVSIATLLLLGLLWTPIWLLLLLELFSYFAVALAAGLHISGKAKGGMQMALVLPLIFATIHLMWGTGFIYRLIRPLKDRQFNSQS